MDSIDKKTIENKLKQEARFLHISIPYDEDEGCDMITFDDGVNTELQYEEGYVPPMFNSENRSLEVMVDLYERKAVGWNEDKGYIHMWGKVIDYGTYTLLDAKMKPLSQIQGYVPNALVPPYERGFGDYLELTINSDGSLPHWKEVLYLSDFVEGGCEPQTIAKCQDLRSIKSNEKAMSEYIIYTTEGHTIAPNENVEIENCQMLGEACGNNLDEAKDNLLKENPWIAEAGFNRSEFKARQVLTNEQRVAIKEVLDYLWEDEERHYEECGKPDNHIFPILKQLNDIIS